jgi:hypothetical protein
MHFRTLCVVCIQRRVRFQQRQRQAMDYEARLWKEWLLVVLAWETWLNGRLRRGRRPRARR